MREFTVHDYVARSSIIGLRIITDINMTETVEDWSRVRSPGRARRRRKLGYRQNIEWRTVPRKDAFRIGNDLVMHPEAKKAFERLMQEQAKAIESKMMAEVLGFGESMSRTTVNDSALTIEHIERARRLLW